MVHVISPDNRGSFDAVLAAMLADRRRALAERADDGFDTAGAVYLVELEPRTQRHLGSVRLLPSTGPHALGALSAVLCERDAPHGDDVWELSRLLGAPGLGAREDLAVKQRLLAALVEFGLLYGIARYICIAPIGELSWLLAAGWECEPLGLPRKLGGEMVAALEIHISPATLQLFRLKSGSRAPVLALARPAVAA